MNFNIDPSRVEEARRQLQAVLDQSLDDQVREALTGSLQLLEDFAAGPVNRSSRHAGRMVYTFEDENYGPCGRKIDICIDYDWDDYDPADEPFASWGPTIADANVLAVRYLDEEGNEIPANVHYAGLAGHLLNKHHEHIIEACTKHGYQHGVGKSPITYSEPTSPTTFTPTDDSAFVPRMAPSEPTRSSQSSRRQLG